MNGIPLIEAQIREHSTSQSFQRGMEYCRADAVLSVSLRDDRIEAEVEISRERAEDPIDSKKSNYYYDAASWLKRAKIGCETSGEREIRQNYVAEIKEEQRRKSSVMPLLKGL